MAAIVIVWEKRSHSGSIGRVCGEVVAVVHKLQNHTHTNASIYSVEVRGEQIPGTFRQIADARAAAERALESHDA